MSAPILMMAGGTGGHVYPALAVANALRDRGHEVEWVGTSRGLEQRVVPAADIKLHHLAVRGVRGKGLLDKLQSLLALGFASVQALWLVLRLRPAAVVGMGGYVAGPAGVAAWLLRRPLLIHEQNAVAGTTNRMLQPLADVVVTGFPGAFKSDVEAIALGNPVREDIVALGEAQHYDYDGKRSLHVLVLGGSLGAKPLNETVPEAVSKLLEEGVDLRVWHQTGEAHVGPVSHAYPADHANVRVAPFIENMAEAYAWADVVICRAGALTVAELAVMARPAILVPLPHAIDDHQTANARSLADRGGAILLRQADMSVAALMQSLRGYLNHPERLRAMSAAARAVAAPDATARVTDRCEELFRDK
ncbi:undecaprenyldiphospho-muramoylpentapeptide beta-N-acetylglucosaminyltransferase [Halioglobus japonicus]|uniref:UDP-N-acetylglucosamine--N-acetylmuramyl-(pentapeptide) pyrophosphoryl-undecaprenol N-acetylglucosamine transferase n=1 Tax=Halioglobus japonicus TaxID=930805 RepID=A0AAP8SP40_9GAMM|nr:undecaprenyldiphospho-muramoylpentapeptide beta-N-acetylglucosaminyltransferase [Halioglobus japonicus]AQA19777.1 undecaprenyldiphospho-muramoylpentapeptide beta-N-acetylglucosaminyltransferase [Halioglobus japonicus]PLW87151.1 undecaprenyldiphospho-muramoylpentapeptide beta-N-acetylglucosaminyltransferase [Halioglobus japonicus]GHD09957.1 UDP-N-acetylglucosamine--N-acetylmuramyl-(pentapeptide) pyrophosphoryl-undecaprenol N-acetylglucosamine transferase [Halioglobus japonicus]